MIVCLPALPLMLWQGWFAVELSFGVLAHKLSACQVIEGAPYEYSGDEIKFAILWPVVILGTLAAATMVYFHPPLKSCQHARDPRLSQPIRRCSWLVASASFNYPKERY